METDLHKNIKMIATDLDGTLIPHGYGLPLVNKKALERAAEQGITTAVATGRTKHSLSDEVKQIKGLKYFVTSNGAKIYDAESGDLLKSTYIKESAIKSVWDILIDPKVMIEIFHDGIPYVDGKKYKRPWLYGIPEDHIRSFTESRTPVPNIYNMLIKHSDNIENINLIFHDKDLRSKVFKDLKKRIKFKNLFSATTSFDFNLEIGGPDVNKGNALKYLARRLNIKSKSIMSIGDNMNDVEMLDYSGLGIAMGDGISEAKQAADFITENCNDNGVAHAIDKYVLNSMVDGEIKSIAT